MAYLYDSITNPIKSLVYSQMNKALHLDEERAKLLSKCNGHQFRCMTDDCATIEGAIFAGEGETRKAVIFSKGLFGYYEGAEDGIRFVESIRTHVSKDITVLLFNPRGMGHSTGIPSLKKYGLDCAAAVTYLTEKGFKASNIVVYGQSLGGISAIYGAKHLHDQGKETPHLIIDRSPYDLAEAMPNLFGQGLLGTFYQKSLQWLDCTGKDAPQILLTLPGKKAIIYATKDNIVTESNSFFTAIGKEKCAAHTITVLKMANRVGNYLPHNEGSIYNPKASNIRTIPLSHHIRAFTENEGKKVARIFRQMLL